MKNLNLDQTAGTAAAQNSAAVTAKPTNGSKSGVSQSSFASYAIGFVLSVLLTIAAYSSVTNHTLPRHTLIAVVVGLAVVQLLIQLLFFLHLGRETKPRWKLMIFLFMLGIVGILVIGSLWIMYNLDYNMTSHDTDKYMLEQEGSF